MLACLDFQMRDTAVAKSLDHFAAAAPALGIHSLTTLRDWLAAEPDDERAAITLWGARYWPRAALLRHLTAYLLERAGGGDELAGLRAWAQTADYKRDFQGRVKGLGPTTFTRMVQQLGADTAAPSGWTCHYVEAAIGRTPKDAELVALINSAADYLNVGRAALDWAIRRQQGHP